MWQDRTIYHRENHDTNRGTMRPWLMCGKVWKLNGSIYSYSKWTFASPWWWIRETPRAAASTIPGYKDQLFEYTVRCRILALHPSLRWCNAVLPGGWSMIMSCWIQSPRCSRLSSGGSVARQADKRLGYTRYYTTMSCLRSNKNVKMQRYQIHLQQIPSNKKYWVVILPLCYEILEFIIQNLTNSRQPWWCSMLGL